MNIYIYDSYVGHKKYQSKIAKIETRITDLGLNGKIIRLGVMSSIYNSIEGEVQKGAKNIIIVGNNNLFAQAINSVAKLKSLHTTVGDIPLGLIPIGKKYNSINITEPGEIIIVNLPMGIELPNEIKANAQDGTLELFIKTKKLNKLLLNKNKENKSVFSFKELQITNPKYPVIIDNSLKINTPVIIKIAKEKINLIVGKGRNF